MPSASRLALLVTALLAPSALATHFRYGIITWEHVSGGSYGKLFNFTIQAAFRATYFSSVSTSSSVDIGTKFVPDMTALSTGTVAIKLLPSIINTGQDWFIGTQTFQYEYPSASSGAKTSFFINCCRISSLLNNHDQNWQITAVVPVVANQVRHSLKTTQVPITSLYVNTLNTFQLGVLNYSGAVTYRLAVTAEAAGSSTIAASYSLAPTASWVAPTNFVINSKTGVMTWNTSSPITTGLYTTQVIVTENTTSDYSAMAIDWILQVVSAGSYQCKRFCYNSYEFCTADSACTSCVGTGYPSSGVPYCALNTPPFFSWISLGGTNQTLVSGQSYSLTYTIPYGTTAIILVGAKDNNIEDYITMGTGVLPSGATFTYADSAGNTYAKNPRTGTFTWAPDANSGGGIVCFTATDTYYTNVGSLCVTITLGTGTLLAWGDGLTWAIAGAKAPIIAQDVSGRTLALSLTSYTTGAISSTAGQFSYTYLTANAAGYQNCSITYNVTGAGTLALQLSDVTSGVSTPPSIYSTVTVYPNVTYPSKTSIFDQGSTGWTGGISGANVTFYLNAFDYFGNLQTLQRTDQFVFNLSTSSTTFKQMVWQNGTVNSVQVYRYAGNYTVPSGNTGSYVVCVYYKSSSTASMVLVQCKTMTSSVTAFTVTNSSVLDITAGTKYTTTLQAYDSTGTLITSNMSLSAYVNGVAASVTFATGGTYTVTGLNITTATLYPGGLVVTAAGLNGVAGSQPFDFNVWPGVPNGPASTIVPSSSTVEFNSLTAGQTVGLQVQLNDAFGNLCNRYRYPVTLVFTDSSNSQTTLYGTALSVKGFYSGSISVRTMGAATLTGTVALTGAFDNSTTAVLPTYSLTIGPGLLNTTYSTLTAVPTMVAGYTFQLSLKPVDSFQNTRSIVNGDSFLVTFSRDSDGTSQTATYAQDPTTLLYVFSLYSAFNGAHTLKILYTIPNVGYGTFTQQSVLVHAGALVNTTAQGSGTKGGIEQTKAKVIVQSADALKNVIEDTGFGYNVSGGSGYKLSGTQAYIARTTSVNGLVVRCTQSTYCTPGTTSCADPSTSPNVTNSTSSSGITTEEKAFQAAGFFRAVYTVPLVSLVSGYGSKDSAHFNLSIWRYDPTTVKVGQSLCDLITNGNATLIKQFDAISTASTSGNSAAQQTLAAVVWGTLGGCMFVSAVGYGAWRLARYRPKYLTERKRAEEAVEHLGNVKDEQLISGVRDFAAVGDGNITQNPLHEANKHHTGLKAQYAQEVNPAYTGGSKMMEMSSPHAKGSARKM